MNLLLNSLLSCPLKPISSKPNVSPPGYATSRLHSATSCTTCKTNKIWLPRQRLLKDRKTNFRLIIYSRSFTNPEKLVKIGPVDFEIIGLTGIVKIKKTKAEHMTTKKLLSSRCVRIFTYLIVQLNSYSTYQTLLR